MHTSTLTRFVSLASLAFSACQDPASAGDGHRAAEGPGAARLSVRLIDAPADVAHVLVSVEGLKLRQCDGGWIELATDSTPLDLLSLTGGSYGVLASDIELPEGHYCEGRIVLGPDASVGLSDGTSHPLHTPSSETSGYKIKDLDFNATDGTNIALTLDFDAGASLHPAGGSDKYVLHPVVSLIDAIAVPSGASVVTLLPDHPHVLEGDGFTLEFPAGSVAAPTTIWCETVTDGVDCGPDGTTFLRSGLLSMSVPEMPNEEDGTVYVTRDGEPTPAISSVTASEVYAVVDHFSQWNWYAYLSAGYIAEDFSSPWMPSPSPGIAAPIRGSVAEGAYARYKFPKSPGKRHTICARATTGQVDLYSAWFLGVSDEFNGYSALEQEAPGSGLRFIAKSDEASDCISIDVKKEGALVLAVFGREASEFELSVVTTELAGKPALDQLLTWPTPHCGRVTYEKYGPFNSPWGNACASNEPYFEWLAGAPHIHNAVDVACGQGNPVLAACDGQIVRVNSAGPIWGSWIGLKCDHDDLSIAYTHVKSIVKEKATVKQGQVIGSIYDLDVAGELDHLHFALCTGPFDECRPGTVPSAVEFGDRVRSGAPVKFYNPDCHTNPGLYAPDTMPPACLEGKVAVHPATCQ